MRGFTYERPPKVSSFTVTSTDVGEGEKLPAAQHSGALGVADGADTSPQLSWSGSPDGTCSFVVTMYDPDTVPKHWT
jgi:phosphatidylethanolamine-binding protein (PEBP) family uncharacterized protein